MRLKVPARPAKMQLASEGASRSYLGSWPAGVEDEGSAALEGQLDEGPLLVRLDAEAADCAAWIQHVHQAHWRHAEARRTSLHRTYPTWVGTFALTMLLLPLPANLLMSTRLHSQTRGREASEASAGRIVVLSTALRVL